MQPQRPRGAGAPAPLVVFCAPLLLTLGGCANRVTPAEYLSDPVPVYLADYGRHSSVLLTTGDRRLTEYAFGDWDWFATNSTDLDDACKALFFSAGATVGRRDLADATVGGHAALLRRVNASRLVRIPVERKKAELLAARLMDRWNRGRDTVVYNPAAELFLVRDPEHYALWHNCNHQTAKWLRELGCSVWGLNATSDFVIKGPAARGATTRLTP